MINNIIRDKLNKTKFLLRDFEMTNDLTKLNELSDEVNDLRLAYSNQIEEHREQELMNRKGKLYIEVKYKPYLYINKIYNKRVVMSEFMLERFYNYLKYVAKRDENKEVSILLNNSVDKIILLSDIQKTYLKEFIDWMAKRNKVLTQIRYWKDIKDNSYYIKVIDNLV